MLFFVFILINRLYHSTFLFSRKKFDPNPESLTCEGQTLTSKGLREWVRFNRWLKHRNNFFITLKYSFRVINILWYDYYTDNDWSIRLVGNSLDDLNITREKNESSSISIKRSLQYLTFTLVNPLCQRPKMTQTFLKASLSFPFLAI